MADERKTVFVNDQPVIIFKWAEVQHCVNAYNSELYLKIQRGEAEIVDKNGDRIGWGGYAGDGQHIYVRLMTAEPAQTSLQAIPPWVDELIKTYQSEPVSDPPRSVWRYTYKNKSVYFIPKVSGDEYSLLFDIDGNEICAPDGGYGDAGDGRCPDFFVNRSDEMLVWKDERDSIM